MWQIRERKQNHIKIAKAIEKGCSWAANNQN